MSFSWENLTIWNKSFQVIIAFEQWTLALNSNPAPAGDAVIFSAMFDVEVQ